MTCYSRKQRKTGFKFNLVQTWFSPHTFTLRELARVIQLQILNHHPFYHACLWYLQKCSTSDYIGKTCPLLSIILVQNRTCDSLLGRIRCMIIRNNQGHNNQEHNNVNIFRKINLFFLFPKAFFIFIETTGRRKAKKRRLELFQENKQYQP